MRFNACAAASLECLELGLYSLHNHAILTCKYATRNEVLRWVTSVEVEDER